MNVLFHGYNIDSENGLRQKQRDKIALIEIIAKIELTNSAWNKQFLPLKRSRQYNIMVIYHALAKNNQLNCFIQAID